MRLGILLAFFFIFTLGHFHASYANTQASTPIDETTVWVPPSLPKTTEAEQKEYFPTEAQVSAVFSHFDFFDVVWATKTHYPRKILQVGRPHQIGIVAYFVPISYDSSHGLYEWTLEERIAQGKGSRVTYWRFSQDRIAYSTMDYPSGNGGATQYINSTHSLWKEAVEKSKQTWEILVNHVYSNSFPP